MKIEVGTGEKARALKAVVTCNGLWVANTTGGVTLLSGDGTTRSSKFRNLASVLSEDTQTKTPIYEGDTITITF